MNDLVIIICGFAIILFGVWRIVFKNFIRDDYDHARMTNENQGTFQVIVNVLTGLGFIGAGIYIIFGGFTGAF